MKRCSYSNFDDLRAAAAAIPVVPDPGPHRCGAPAGPMATEESFWLGLNDLAENMRCWRRIL